MLLCKVSIETCNTQKWQENKSPWLKIYHGIELKNSSHTALHMSYCLFQISGIIQFVHCSILLL